MKEKLLVVCPGRGTYNATELGYLKRHHAGGGAQVARLDAYRTGLGQPTISALDGAEKYSPSLHMPGDNASLLIYACALADFAAEGAGTLAVEVTFETVANRFVQQNTGPAGA